MTPRDPSVAVVADSRRRAASLAAVHALSDSGYLAHRWVAPEGAPKREFALGVVGHRCNLLVTLTGPYAAIEIAQQVVAAAADDEHPYDLAGWVHAGPATGSTAALRKAAATLLPTSNRLRPDLWFRIATIRPGATRGNADHWAPVLDALHLLRRLRRDLTRYEEREAAVARIAEGAKSGSRQTAEQRTDPPRPDYPKAKPQL